MSEVTADNLAGDATVEVRSGESPKPASEFKDLGEAPRILGNEIIVKPIKRHSADHLDELSSLEREIAEMHNVHNVEESGLNNTSSTNLNTSSGEYSKKMDVTATSSTNNNDQMSSESHQIGYVAKNNAVKDAALEHEDLIAVLKGLDDTHNTSADTELLEGVTIEGEGEYQIMEVVDDEIDGSVASLVTEESTNEKKTFGATVLTVAEERALALEQMACLKTKQPRQAARRRKQDIKPIQQTDPLLDLVSSLEAEWTDNDEEAASNNSTPTNVFTRKESSHSVQKGDAKSNIPQITSVVVIPPSTSQTTNAIISSSLSTDPLAETSNSNDMVLSPVESIIETRVEEESPMQGTSNSGFRRTRIIKRKIIWDPDAPETTFSYAKLVSKNKPKVKPEVSIPMSTMTKGSTTIKPIKNEAITTNVPKKAQRPATPKDKLTSNINSTEKKILANSKTTSSTGNEKLLIGSSPSKEVETNNKLKTDSIPSTSSSPSTEVSPANKRRSQTPVANGPGVTKKKKPSEIDRLMGDEGAVNMLHSLEKLEATLGTADNKATRPMMRSRAATICERIPRKEPTSPVKTSPPTSNQPASKVAKRTPKSRAASSWDYVYKQKQNVDESMIIRRRSNSSYSSTASLNRLSIDGPPTPSNGPSSASKVNESKSTPTSTTTTPENISTKSASRKSDETASSSASNKSAGAASKNSPKSFEFAKPETKKTQRRTKSPAGTLTSDMQTPALAANKRNSRSPANTTSDDNTENGSKAKVSTSAAATAKEKTHISDVVVKKSAKVTQILFTNNKAKLNYTFTTQMLNKLSDILDKLATDPDTHVAVLTTNDVNFCQGIDLAEIALGSGEKRKPAIKNLSTAVKNYVNSLSRFPKPLIAGVTGHVMNFGVIQLAFFDVVVAGDKCTFETPYAKIGQIPEAYSVWNGMNKIRGSFKTKLFWLNEKIQSTEAALAGLVNKLTIGNKVNDEALNIAKRFVSTSPETYRLMKKSITGGYLELMASYFDDELLTITEQWSSSEFLSNLTKYMDQGHF